MLAHGYHFVLHETPVVALPQAALWLPRTRTLVASDLHFEKASSFAHLGTFLPPFDTTETIARLIGLMDALQPEMLIALGDSFHDMDAGNRLHHDDQAELINLSSTCKTVWIEGNHDPDVPNWLHGQRCADMHHDGLFSRTNQAELF